MPGEMLYEDAVAVRRRIARMDEETDGGVSGWIADHCLDLSSLHGTLPDPEQQLPEAGGWVVIRTRPHTAIPSPPFASFWRAVPVFVPHTFRGGAVPGSRAKTLRTVEERARITTPAGELTLLATEYAVVRDLGPYIEAIDEGVQIHYLGAGVVAGDIEERTFYLRAHGLRRREALTLLLPEVEDQGFAWLSVDGVSDVEEYEAALAAHRRVEKG